MTLPQVTITELDGALGILPLSAGSLYAVVGPSTGGPLNLPATFGRVKDVIATYGAGPLVESAAHFLERYGRPVIIVRTATAADGVVSSVTADAEGSSAVTVASGAKPDDDHEVVLRIVHGGTRGTAGITYQVSVDAGRSFSPVTALGTADHVDVPEAGILTLAISAGNLVAGDLFGLRTAAPTFDATGLGAALAALANSAASWEIVHVAGPIDASAFDTVETKLAALFAIGKYRAWVGNVRAAGFGETEAAYLTAMTTAFGVKAAKFGALCGGSCKLPSSVSGRIVRRPVSFAYAALEASVSAEVDTADVNLGPLAGVSIRDANGNPDEHDEAINPGLDDARFVTLRTWDGLAGVYVTRPRMFSAEGSDFYLLPHRRVLNLAHAALRQFFIRRLNRPIRVNKTTGYILESEALEIEEGARAVMRGVLLAKPKASAINFVLSRTDSLLSTRTLTGQGRVTPLAYPEDIELDVGYHNPALLVQAVAA
jgi:hypothetical protein